MISSWITIGDDHTSDEDNIERIAIYLIKYMTVYAFSTKNWKRSKNEVATLIMSLTTRLAKMIQNEIGALVENKND